VSDARIDELFLILSKTPECFDKALRALCLPAFHKVVFHRLAHIQDRGAGKAAPGKIFSDYLCHDFNI